MSQSLIHIITRFYVDEPNILSDHCAVHFSLRTIKKGNGITDKRFGSATRTQNFEREVFFYYFSNFPLFLFVKLPDFRSRSLGPAISHCCLLFFPKLRV